MGLLARSLSLTQENNHNVESISFIQFTKKYNISLCAVFSKIDNNYIITNSIGFDGISIISSISTTDFWNGTIKNSNEWQSFTTNSEMIPFYQLFSFNFKDKINSIYIHRFGDKIFMACSAENFSFIPNNAITNDLSNISFKTENSNSDYSINLEKNENIYKYQLDVKNAIEFHIQKNLRLLEYKNTIQETISNEIVNFLKRSFSSPHLISSNEYGIFNIAYISETEVPEQLIKTHLIKELGSILDDESKLIAFTNLGKSNSYKDVIDFLQAK